MDYEITTFGYRENNILLEFIELDDTFSESKVGFKITMD